MLAIFAFTVWAVTTNGPSSSRTSATDVQIEQVSSDALMPSHCDPSNCTPEQASKCPYSNSADVSAASNAENNSACPATKECPPSKCQGEKAEKTKATL